MSHSFKCGQFNDAFLPKRLKNWEAPRWDPEKPYRDPFSFKKTEVIANERGHLLPGITRPDRNPWNNYVGTNDMPAVITKAIATDIATRPAYCIEYLDKPNPIKAPVKEPIAGFKFKRNPPNVAESHDDPDRSRNLLTTEEYAEHDKRIQDASELAKEFMKCRQLIPKWEVERACRARELERELWTNRECQRRAELHQDVNWLKNNRIFPNVVSRQMNWSAKNDSPRSGLGVDSPIFGIGGTDVVSHAFSAKPRDVSFFEKKRVSSIKVDEEELKRNYQLCHPDLSSASRQIHRVNNESDEECVPYEAREQNNGARSKTGSVEEGGGGGLSSLNMRGSIGGGGGTPYVEFYCPVARGGAPRPVITGELIDPNVKNGGYLSKKNQRIRGEYLPEHDCSQGCTTPVKKVVNECPNGGSCSPTNQQNTQNFDYGQICQNGGCSPSPEERKSRLSPLRSTRIGQNPANLGGNEFGPEYSQLENADELLRKSQLDLHQVETGCSEQAYRNPNIASFRQGEVHCGENPNLCTTGACPPRTPPGRGSPKLSGDTQGGILPSVEVPPRQTLQSAPPTATSLPPTKPPPPTPNVGAQFSLIGDPSQFCQASAPPQRAPPPASTALAAAPAATVAAKELKSANLEHQPLADAIREAGFCRLASQGHPNPGIALDCVPAASGIGWRPFDAPGPTNCSKQRVYRPHTAGCGMHNTQVGAALARAARPSTSAPRRRHVSAMELAICWDTIPDYPEDEPRPPKHVDGSNGSAAPGIFCRVPAPERTPAVPTPPLVRTPMNHEPNSDEIKARLAMLQRDRAASAAIEACRRAGVDQHRRRSAGGDPRNLEDHIGAGLKASISATNAARRRLPRRAMPRRVEEQVSEAPRINRSCEACTAPNCDEPSNAHRLPPAPFKAGKAPVCLSTNSSFNDGGSLGTGRDAAAAKSLNVPRPRHPFSSRGYEITTLAQPFAMDKNGSAGGAYPEHWRLASVYQLSYKPMVSRNKPLMKTVFQ